MRGSGSGSVSVAGLACYRAGHRTRLIYRMHHYRGRKGETKAFTWTEYQDLLTAAHRQLPGGNIVLIWDNPNVHLRAELRAFTTAQPWLRVFQLPSYAPDLNPVGLTSHAPVGIPGLCPCQRSAGGPAGAVIRRVGRSVPTAAPGP